MSLHLPPKSFREATEWRGGSLDRAAAPRLPRVGDASGLAVRSPMVGSIPPGRRSSSIPTPPAGHPCAALGRGVRRSHLGARLRRGPHLPRCWSRPATTWCPPISSRVATARVTSISCEETCPRQAHRHQPALWPGPRRCVRPECAGTDGRDRRQVAMLLNLASLCHPTRHAPVDRASARRALRPRRARLLARGQPSPRPINHSLAPLLLGRLEAGPYRSAGVLVAAHRRLPHRHSWALSGGVLGAC